jgi:hypothetical protein
MGGVRVVSCQSSPGVQSVCGRGGRRSVEGNLREPVLDEQAGGYGSWDCSGRTVHWEAGSCVAASGGGRAGSRSASGSAARCEARGCRLAGPGVRAGHEPIHTAPVRTPSAQEPPSHVCRSRRWRRSPKQPQLPQSASGSTERSLAWTSRSPDVDGAADAEVLYAFRMTSQGLLKAGKATGAPRLLLLRRKAAAVGACDSWPRRRSASGL